MTRRQPQAKTLASRRRSVGSSEAPAAGGTHLEKWSYVATIVSSAVAVAALVFGSYQFYRTLIEQREAARMQRAALINEQHAKAGEFFQKFIELKMEPYVELPKQKADEARFVKAQKALTVLNAVYLVTKEDKDWHEVVDWSVRQYWPIVWAVRERKVMCLALTSDFRKVVESISEESDAKICNDLNY